MLQETVSGTRTHANTKADATAVTQPRKTGDLALSVGLHFLLIIGAIIMAAPFLWMVLTSVKTNAQAFSVPPTFLPNPFVWENYPKSLEALPFGYAYINSTYITILVVFFTLITSSMAGYAFAKINFPGRNIIFFLFLATLMIPFQLTIIPQFLILTKLGWIDSHLALIVPPALFNAFGVFLLRQFIKGIPAELEEAAFVDGANRWTIFWRIIMPLIRAPLSALGIFTFMGTWNNFFYALVYLNTPELFTVPMMLNQFRGQYNTEWALVMAGSVIAVLPILIVYIILQRQIIQGIALTGLKA